MSTYYAMQSESVALSPSGQIPPASCLCAPFEGQAFEYPCQVYLLLFFRFESAEGGLLLFLLFNLTRLSNSGTNTGKSSKKVFCRNIRPR